jgi:hypothetical protein
VTSGKPNKRQKNKKKASNGFSFDFKNLKEKKDLNPNIWVNGGEKLNPEVRERLIQIALRFYKELEFEGNWSERLKDLIFTGSLANYNWSKFSDLDLHLILDFDEISPDSPTLVERYLKAKKSIWNDEHDIKIHGFEIELYAEDKDHPHFSSGMYSVLNDEWKVRPTSNIQLNKSIDKEKVRHKTKNFVRFIDEVIRMGDSHEEGEPDKLRVLKLIDRLQDKIKNMRQCGLERDGEFSVENLTFKLLRRNGALDRLYEAERKIFDNLMTLS